MKGLLFFLSAVISHAASADFKCTDLVNQTEMQLIEHFPSRTGDALVKLTYVDGQALQLTAQSGIEQGNKIFFKKKYSLYPHTGDMVTITSAPKNCGRALCDDHFVHHASLNLKGVITTFKCHEIFP